MHSHFKPALISGLIAAGLFLLVAVSGLGFFFLFLPTLPLLIGGMAVHPRVGLWGAGMAMLLIGSVAGIGSAMMFLLSLGLPAWYICRYASRSRQISLSSAMTGGNAITFDAWFPVGLIFTYLTLYACGLIALMALFYIAEPGGIEEVIAQHIRTGFSEAQGEYKEVVELLAGQWSFLIFSMTVWLWALALYAHLWFAGRLLEKQKKIARPDFAIRPFIMPNWMFSLMAICALASLVGGPTTAFLGKTTLIAVMLPYFLLGIGIMHAASRSWPSRRIFLFFIYFLIFAQFWPAFALSFVGIAHHIKRLSMRGASTKS